MQQLNTQLTFIMLLLGLNLVLMEQALLFHFMVVVQVQQEHGDTCA